MDFVGESEVHFSRKVEKVVFGFWSLSPKYQTISDGVIQRELEPLLFSLLTYFIKHNDRIVSRQELVDEVWKQAYVDDNAINRAMSELRKVLKSERQKAQVIKTHYRKGYSFSLEIEIFYHQAKTPIESIDKNETNLKVQSVKQPEKKSRTLKLDYRIVLFALLCLVPVAFFLHYNSDEEKVRTLGSSSTLLTWKKGVSITPNMSKSLRYLAYAFRSSESETFDLYIKNNETLREFKVAENQANVYPIGWSVNDELYYQIAESFGEPICELWKVNLSAGPTNAKHQKLLDCDSNEMMSADGTRDGSTLLYTKLNYRGRKDLSVIVSRNLRSENEFQVSSPAAQGRGDYYVKLSKDEKRIVFLRRELTGTKIFIANIDGSDQKELMSLSYFVRAVSWDNEDASLSWLDVKDKMLNTYEFDSGTITKSQLRTEYTFDDFFGADLVSEDHAIIATNYLDSDILQLDLTNNESSWFTNTDVYELGPKSFSDGSGGLYIVGKKSRSIWSQKDGVRKKLIDLDFSKIRGLALSPDNSRFVVASPDELFIYRVADFSLLERKKFDGVIYKVDWPEKSTLLLTYNDGSQLSGWAYNLENEGLIKLTKSIVKSIVMLDEQNALIFNGTDKMEILNLLSGNNRELDFFEDMPAIQSLEADENYIYYSMDNKEVYKRSLADISQREKLIEFKSQYIVALHLRNMAKAPSLLLTLTSTKENLLLDLKFSEDIAVD